MWISDAWSVCPDVPQWSDYPVDLLATSEDSITLQSPRVGPEHPVESLLLETRYQDPASGDWTAWTQAVDQEIAVLPAFRPLVISSLQPSTTYQIRAVGRRRGGSRTRPSASLTATTLGRGMLLCVFVLIENSPYWHHSTAVIFCTCQRNGGEVHEKWCIPVLQVFMFSLVFNFQCFRHFDQVFHLYIPLSSKILESTRLANFCSGVQVSSVGWVLCWTVKVTRIYHAHSFTQVLLSQLIWCSVRACIRCLLQCHNNAQT